MSQPTQEKLRAAILRTVAFFDAMDYPPSWVEVQAWGEFGFPGRQDDQDVGVEVSSQMGGAGSLEFGEGDSRFGFRPDPRRPACPERSRGVLTSRVLEEAKHFLVTSNLIEEGEGRIALKDRLAPLLELVRQRTPLFPRKLRVARKVARWLSRHPAVRFVALANTTALGHARDEGDLDFFVIVKHGYLWSARLWGSGWYKLLGRLPGAVERADDVCLSYFISDAGLDLSSHRLQDGDDPYFRYWLLALLPLYDDGVSRELWQANREVLARHPRALPWIPSPDKEVWPPVVSVPVPRFMERIARAFQQKWFPANIRERMGKATDVIVSDTVLKFHVDDGRAKYREAYQDRLTKRGMT